MDNNYWYVLFVSTGEEDNVRDRLRYTFGDKLKLMVPKKLIRERRKGVNKEVEKVLFRGYVFINSAVDFKAYYEIKNTPGVIKFLKSGTDILQLEEDEAEILDKLLSKDEIIGISNIFIENSEIRVIDGPLKNFEGKIVKVDRRKGRAKVLFTFCGSEKLVDLGVNEIDLCNE